MQYLDMPEGMSEQHDPEQLVAMVAHEAILKRHNSFSRAIYGAEAICAVPGGAPKDAKHQRYWQKPDASVPRADFHLLWHKRRVVTGK